MACNSKRKGVEGEREWAKFCREQGYDVRRSQQYAGGTEESADCIGLPYIHQEVKRVQALNIDEALEQAQADISMAIDKAVFEFKDMFELMAIVAHRKNGKRWKVTMYAEDWFKIYKEYESSKAIWNRKYPGKKEGA
ncbi:MAG: hypothetical protein N3I35_06610 [Clostridia bacterium]|nr:hypothetical protein [Clostridia bacterium]